MSIRPILETRHAQPTMEGAGVHLHRAFGFQDPPSSTRSSCSTISATTTRMFYRKGFPWHPHRGIETITYVLEGTVEHSDSLGNTGRLGAGSVQWMTAGSGILHQEMPLGNAKGQMHGFQLWGNLPGSMKMTAPRYQDIQGGDIPESPTMTAPMCGSSPGSSGARRAPWTGSPPIRNTSM
jgi:redox-sensitive bicupin YhaK (pirin superfamily)